MTDSSRTASLEQRLRHLMDTLNVGVFRTAEDGEIIEGNRAFFELLGVAEREELRPYRAGDLYAHPEERAAILMRLERDGSLRDHEVELRRPDGVGVWVSLSVTRTVEPDGTVVLDGLLEDITARRAAEEALHRSEAQLLQAQKMEAVGRLAGGIAHDFNNLLLAIGGFGSLLLDKLDDDDPRRRYVVQINGATRRAATLTSQLLAFSRKQMLQPRVLDLNEVVLRVKRMLVRMIGEDVDLVSILDPDLHTVRTDPGQMEQVLFNLAVNARDAMPAGGRLTIETRNVRLGDDGDPCVDELYPGEYARLSVSDTGHGMDAFTLDNVFEPFFTTKEPGKGTGLGLSTVYGIIKQSGGGVTAASTPDKGTTFHMYLPSADADADVSSEIDIAGVELIGTETVLLVEDEPIVRRLGAEILESYGYTVLQARHGEEALVVAQRTEDVIHLLLTDVVMPRMSGQELAERFAATRPDTRVLFTSGYADRDPRNHAMGEAPFISKPFTPEELARMVRSVLGPRTLP